jgi:hypothetical protein
MYIFIFIFNETNSVTTGHVNPGPSFNEKATVYIYSQICPRQCEKSPLHICMYVCMYVWKERKTLEAAGWSGPALLRW